MLRLLHTSDWHLGRQLYGHSLIDDQAFALERLLELIDRQKPHALLIAGDVFDRALPPEAAVTLLDRFLQRAAGQRELPVFMIPGNHDSCERLGFASGLLRDRGVTIFAKIEDAFQPVALKGDDGMEALIYGIPFVEPAVIARLLEDQELETPDLALKALCRKMLQAKACQRPAVLLCHAFVAGAETSESEKDIFIGGSSLVNPSAFEGFSYTALGHLHKPQSAGGASVRYSGSLLAYSKSEIPHTKGILEVRLDASSRAACAEHRLPCRRPLRAIEGEFETLLEQAKNDPAREDYVIATYTDHGAVLDAFSKLHAFYPFLLHVSRAIGFNPEELPALSRVRERQAREQSVTELELFAEFYQAVAGQAMSEAERTALIEAIAELERSSQEAPQARQPDAAQARGSR